MGFKLGQKIIDKIRGKKDIRAYLKRDFYKSYSQFGEDMCLRAIMHEKYQNPYYKGFYIDIGAHDPIRYSNTATFYDIGWRGINIDAQFEAIEKFKEKRPDDINLNIGIANKTGKMDYYTFSDHAINSFSKEFANK